MNKVRQLLIILIAIFLLNIGSFTAEATEKIVLQLRWDHQFQFAGYYAALWQGYYEDEGLEVEIRSAFTEDGEVLNATDEVAEERADFGVGAVDILIANDKDYDLSIIASIFQRSAVEFFMMEETPFTSIVDLVNLKTARREKDLLDIELQAMLIAEGINPNQLELYQHAGNFTVADLIVNGFDVVPIYLSSILYYSEEKGIKLKSIKPIDYGIDFYGDSLFTRQKLTMDNPQMVESFKRASLKGWEYALENPDEIAEKIAQHFITEDKNLNEFIAYNKFQADKVLELTFHPVVEIGNINPHRWEKTHETLYQLDLVSGNAIMDQIIFDYEAILMEESKRQERIMRVLSFSALILLLVILLIHLTVKNTMNQLEKLFQKEMEENKKKEGIIIYQARMAAMGEMIANIAHQWRQPLNNLGLIITNIEDEYIHSELTKESLEDAVERSRRLINKMSDTIDDFRYFSNPKTNKEEFLVYDNIVAVLELFEEKLKLNNIKISFKDVDVDKAYGYSNQYSQAIFNIIVNSIDALVQNTVENREISVNIYKSKESIVTEIEDNGGGINEDIKDNIFDIYFTTKDKSQGTGLGLYMTKIIVENNLNGKISWENTGVGVKMIIEVPCKGVDENVEG
ncbi:ABC transporter substrate-binding protein [Alkaliphilus peptidifermentans]|uniref:histidine kinase n=1 Tax=Alkaliphilus peptidifermentans DSM 18978 TaxID=1120976 RepID=A0A1G5JWG4_9FIRM|nr:ABC transporter substrate-binding protein [Alkaliphilus peptidifermentans]SCY92657.1 Histidine kinase-, DNA gyrase B-, and HSP90-like ATPase [Alkaliphilus peptidifermentans DSM 18978]